MAKAIGYKLVQVNMAEDTLEKLSKMQERLHADTRTNTIRSSIDIADLITDTLSHGGKILIEDKGNKYQLVVPGISHGG